MDEERIPLYMPKATPSTDLVVIDGPMTPADVIAYYEHPERFEFHEWEQDSEEVARSIALRDIGAQSAEELFGEEDVLHGKEYVNRPFRLDSVEFRPSDFEEEGERFYAVFRIFDIDGTGQVMTCGAASVMRKAAVAAKNGWLPRWLKIVRAEKPTERGYYPLDLVAAPEPFPTDS